MGGIPSYVKKSCQNWGDRLALVQVDLWSACADLQDFKGFSSAPILFLSNDLHLLFGDHMSGFAGMDLYG